MTVSELILKIDAILNLGIADSLDVSSQTLAEAMKQDSRCKSLLECCNLVSDELFGDYAPSCRTTVVQAADGFIDTSLLSMSKALTIVDSVGRSVPFKYGQGGLLVERDGKYNLTYARLPERLTFDSVAQTPNSKITDRIFIYGVIAEYLRICGDYSQSASWAVKYKQALSVALSSKATARLPYRRWLK